MPSGRFSAASSSAVTNLTTVLWSGASGKVKGMHLPFLLMHLGEGVTRSRSKRSTGMATMESMAMLRSSSSLFSLT